MEFVLAIKCLEFETESVVSGHEAAVLWLHLRRLSLHL